MKIHPVAKRYARALFELARERKKTDKYFLQIKSFSNLLNKDERLQYYFLSPKIEKRQKIQSLEAILKNKVDDIIYNFLLLLIKKNRLEYYEQIVFFLDRFNDEQNNRLNAKITSVIPLKKLQIKEISNLMSKSFNANIVLENKVSSEILGGVVVQIEGKIIDDSLLQQLQKLQQQLKRRKT